MTRLSALLVVLSSWLASPALAQRHDTTHALWVGGRFEPGAALNVGYDLEIELGTSCGFNVGPSLSVAFLGGDGGERRQDLLGTLDLLRGRFLLDDEHCDGRSCGYRLQALLGAGAYFVTLPASGVEVPKLLRSTDAPAVWRFGGQVSGGLSADWWLSAELAVTGLLVFHVRLDDFARMPAIWAEAGLGLRFGT